MKEKDLDSWTDVYNEVYQRCLRRLGLEPQSDQVILTFEQAASLLELSRSTVLRYAYSKPPKLILGGVQYESRGITLESVCSRITDEIWQKAKGGKTS